VHGVSAKPRGLNSLHPSPPHNTHKLSARLRTRWTNPHIQEDLSDLFRWYFGAEVGRPRGDQQKTALVWSSTAPAIADPLSLRRTLPSASWYLTYSCPWPATTACGSRKIFSPLLLPYSWPCGTDSTACIRSCTSPTRLSSLTDVRNCRIYFHLAGKRYEDIDLIKQTTSLTIQASREHSLEQF
jgi:hypothetical protein